VTALALALLSGVGASLPPVVAVETPAVRLAPGGRGDVAFVARIREGFRIQANPASQPFLVPAQLDLGSDPRLDVGPACYPPGKPHRLEGTDEALSVYEGEAVIRVRIGVGPDVAPSTRDIVLQGRLRYQACNATMCLRPAEVGVTLRVGVRRTP
jgi:hypothetical protein